MDKINTLFAQGLDSHKRGDYASAKNLYQLALAIDPNHFDALYLASAIAHQESDLNLAKDLLLQAIKINPNHTEANFNLGVILGKLDEFENAIKQYDRLISISPSHVEGLFNRAALLAKLGKINEAALEFKKVLELSPNLVAAQQNFEKLQNEIISDVNPKQQYLDIFTTHHQNGLMLCESKKHNLAIEQFKQALNIKPDSPEALHNIGMAYEKIGNLDKAVECYQSALKLLPDSAPTHNNLGNVFRELNDLNKAIHHLEEAIRLNPLYAEAFSNLGWTLYRTHEFDRAIGCFQKAVMLNPNLDAARFNLSLCQLILGDYLNGWKNYEYRTNQPSYINSNNQLSSKQWSGSESLEGKTIYIYAEQGFGDTIQFCRYLELLEQKGARVIFKPQAPLLRLLKNVRGVSSFVIPGQPIPPHDFHSPLMSLPLALKTTPQNIPNKIPYLVAEKEKQSYWSSKLHLITKPKIGLVWSGGFRPDQPEIWGVNKRRNIELTQISKIQSNNFHFVSLQKGTESENELKEKQVELWPSENFSNFNDELVDFSDTAALIMQLDLIISVDTSTAHLAAALGKPVWILNRFDSCWRWGIGDVKSAWYPNIKLYRQTKDGDWSHLIEKVKADLGTSFLDNTRT